MSLAPPRRPARCAASGCARRGSTSSATRGRGGEDPEPLLRAALSGGVDIVQLREKELPRREIERAGADLPPRSATPTAPSSSSTTTPTWPASCDADGVHVGQDDIAAAEARELLGPGGDHRPLDPLRGADRRRRRGARRLHQRRPDLGDADQGGPARRRARADRARRARRAPSLLRDRRHRRRQRRRGGRGRRRRLCVGAGDPRRRRPRAPRRRRCDAVDPASARRAG